MEIEKMYTERRGSEILRDDYGATFAVADDTIVRNLQY